MDFLRLFLIGFVVYYFLLRFFDFHGHFFNFSSTILTLLICLIPLFLFPGILKLSRKVPIAVVVVLCAATFGSIQYLADISLPDVRDGVSISPSSRPVAIVTGANSGIGFSTAQQLAEAGFDVVLACRSDSKCLSAASEMVGRSSNLDEKRLHPMNLDLSDLENIYAFTKKFKQRFHRLDLLINNAGFTPKTNSTTKQNLEEGFGSMHIGHFALTMWLVDSMQATSKLERSYLVSGSPAPIVVVNVASELYRFGSFDPSILSGLGEGDLRGEKMTGGMIRSVLGSYARAKLANVLFTQELQRRINESQVISHEIETYSVHPGLVFTNISGRSNPILDVFNVIVCRSSDQSGRLLVATSLPRISKYSVIPGSYINGIGKSAPAAPNVNDQLADRLWFVSKRLVEEWMKTHRLNWSPEAKALL
jgi:NAD(P)-dependent dehydrogenase (short-subunit alcohol dehydrogenase family)